MMRWDASVCDKNPLFWPIRGHARAFCDYGEWPDVAEYDRLFGGDGPVRFRESPPRPRRARRQEIDPRRLYDGRICEERVVPTRARNWHDFFNALVWAAFPATKARLHERQHHAAAQRMSADAVTLPSARTREQDGLALLDEGGVALLCTADAVGEARRALEMRQVEPVAQLAAEARALGVIYGHAIYEHLARGGPNVRAMTAIVPCFELPADPAACVERCDTAFAAALADPRSFSRPDEHQSLPVDAGVLGFR